MTFPTVTVQVAFDKRISEAAADVDFTTVTTANPVRQFVIKRGKGHVLDTQQAGTAIFIFDDANGNLDPENKSSPYYDSAAGKTKVLPMRHIRIHAVDPATSSGYYLFRGFIEGWESNYGKSGKDQIAKCTAVDAFKAFALAKGTDATETAEGSGQRLIDLVTMTGFPIATVTGVTAAATDQTVAEKKYTLSEDLLLQMQDIDIAEVGFFYCDRNGIPTFKNRQSRIAVLATKKGTFTDGSTSPGSTWSYDFLDFSRDDDEIINQADSTIYGTATVGTQANDATSQADYGIRSLTNTALMLTTAGAATTWNDYAIDRLAQPDARVRSISWEQGADGDDDRWAPILGGDIGEFYEVERTTPAGTLREAFVLTEQITHQVKAGKWRTTWALSAASTDAYWILEDAIWGKLGTTTRLWFG